MNNTIRAIVRIVIDPSDLNSMVKIMDKYGPLDTMLGGLNDNNEKTYNSIFKDKIVVVTNQKNGWVRKNIYWRDGTCEELFEGKWV